MDKTTGRFIAYKKETVDRRGYVYINISLLGDPKLEELCRQSVFNRAYGRRRSGMIYKHHVEMIKKLGRPLVKGEVIHHIDGNPGNNNINNLQVTNTKAHFWMYKNLLIENARLKEILTDHGLSF